MSKKLKPDFKLVTSRFHESRMLLNPGKCHYINLGSKFEKGDFSFDRRVFENSKEEPILGVTVDN